MRFPEECDREKINMTKRFFPECNSTSAKTAGSSFLCGLGFWGLSGLAWFAIWYAVATHPEIAFPACIILTALLCAKFLAVASGTVWICCKGRDFAITQREWEVSWLASERKEQEKNDNFRLAHTLGSLSESVKGWCWWLFWISAPFGLFDHRCRWMAMLSDTPSTCERVRKWLWKWGRNIGFRFESLMVLTTLALVGAPFQALECWWRAVLFILIVILLMSIAAMSVEVMCGNVIMGPGYDRYCHYHFELPLDHFRDGTSPDGHRTLRQVWMFVRLCVFSICASAAAFYASNALSGYCGFDEIDAVWPADAERLYPSQRIAEYMQFLYFTTTTFATVGYGDIHPLTLWPRVLTMAFQLVGMGMILVLLQLILQSNGWPTRNPAEAKTVTPHGE